MSLPKDSWQSGDPYEYFMGRWSKLIAPEFLGWLNAPPEQRWLDVGCGTGALSQAILEICHPREILAIDSSAEFIAHNRENVQDLRIQFEVELAQSMSVEAKRFDLTVSGLVLNFIPEPGRAVVEMRRVTKPGGTVAVYVWDYAEGMQMLRLFWDAAIALDSSASNLDEAARFPLCQPDELEKLFRENGLSNVMLQSVEVPTVFSSFDDYWQPLLGGVGPAPGYVTGLDDARREALREHLRASLALGENGSIPLLARAWAVRGTV